MASDKTGNIAHSHAQTELNLVLGERRVQLAELRPEELSEFLFEQLRQVELRGLRGFAPLCDVLARGDDEGSIRVANTCELYRTSPVANPQLGESFSLRTQSVKVCRGVCFQKLTYKRLESDEETEDYNVAKGWGGDAYMTGTERILVLIRPANHSGADENLVALDYRFAKAPYERRHLITSVMATSLSKESFCPFFGEKAPEIARDIIWELRSIHSRTLDQLVSQTDRMREKISRWERISYSVE